MRVYVRFIAVAVLLCLVLQGVVAAQERVESSDLLRWLPDQAYRKIAFTDFASLRAAALWKEMQVNSYMPDQEGWFIEDMAAKLTAVPLDIKWRGEDTTPTYGDMVLAEGRVGEESAEVLKGYELAHREIRVMVFEDAEAVLGKAVEIGVLTQHDEQSYRGYDFYLMKRPVTHEKTGRWIVTTVDGHYLLMAPSIRQLKRMIDTNGQRDLSALESDHLEDLIGRVGDLGQRWRYEASAVTLTEVHKAIAETNGWPPAALKRVHERHRYKRRCVIFSDVYDEQWHLYSYYVFDPEIALEDSAEARKLAPAELGETVEPRLTLPEMEFSLRIDENAIIFSQRRDVLYRMQWQKVRAKWEKLRAARKKNSKP